MAESKPPRREQDPSHADPAWLLNEAARAKPPESQRDVPPPPSDYELEAGGDTLVDFVPPPLPPEPKHEPAYTAKPGAAGASSKPKKQAQARPDAAVDEVWSRSAEWGGTLVALGGAGFLSILFLYSTLGAVSVGVWAIEMFVLGVFMLYLAYPLAITLERPVRITPEQAARDFFHAASHHRPHYKRMWLLLSTPGRVSSSFGSFEGFRGYWREKIVELRRGRAGSFTPLDFEVADFRSEKSTGKTSVDAKYTVRVFVRGKHSEGPVASIAVETSLVKGPDRMWYLNQGTLS